MRVVVVSLATGLLPTFLVGALSVPISDDLDVGAATIGAAVSAFFLAAALTSMPAGRQVDRRGAAFGYRVGLTGVGLAAGAVGLLVSAGWHLVVAFAFAGVSLAFVDPSIARTITGSVGWRRQGIAFGIKESAVPSASMLAGITLPLLGATLGWQLPFLTVAVLAVVIAVLVPSNIEVANPHRGSSRATRATSEAMRDRSSVTTDTGDSIRDASPVRTIGKAGPRRGKRASGATAGGGTTDADTERSGTPAPRAEPQAADDAEAAADVEAAAAVRAEEVRTHELTDERTTEHTHERTTEHTHERTTEHTHERTTEPTHERTREPTHERTDGRTSGGLVLLAVASGLGGGAGAAVATFIVPTAIVIGVGATAAGLVLSAASLGSIGVRLGAGWFVDRRPQAVFDLLVALLGAGLVGGIALAAAAHLGAAPVEVDALAGAVVVAGETASATPVVVTLLVIGAVLLLGPGWGWTGLVFLTATRLTPERPAQASGTILAGLGGGGALFPLGAGWLAESVGFGWTWTAIALAMSLSVTLMLIVRAKR
jgi:MFS family permease